MNPPCAGCEKTVYPMEKLNCLNKIWHKACFRCQTCNLALTMKTYKGYNNLPYCNTHYPTTKFTAVADTPENRRLAKNTSQQSNIVYHKSFEEGKGHMTSVADDPETLRAKKNTKQSSNLQYQDRGPQAEVDREESARSSPPKQYQPPPPQQYQAPPPQPEPQGDLPPPPSTAPTKKRVALYDYAAADDDEVSFVEGDVIIDVTVIDDGWLEGRVERTGQYGMMPSNYVEQ